MEDARESGEKVGCVATKSEAAESDGKIVGKPMVDM